MPLHDWADERGWDSVHPFWLAYLVEWIQPRLPEGYRACLGGVPALTVSAGNGKPDVSVRRWGPGPAPETPTTGTGVRWFEIANLTGSGVADTDGTSAGASPSSSDIPNGADTPGRVTVTGGVRGAVGRVPPKYAANAAS